MNQLDCTTVRRYLGEGMDISRNSDRCKAIRSHLQSCPDCTSYIESLDRTIDCYRSYPLEMPTDTDALIDEAMHLIQKKAE